MKKYIVTDREGRSNGHSPITPGRYVNRDGENDEPFRSVSGDCYDSPLLAVLLATVKGPANETRLFAVDHWGATGDPGDARGYTVIKEVPAIPAVDLEKKVDFAVALLARLYRDDGFRDWARAWLSGTDRTRASAQHTQKSIQQDLDALHTVDELAGSEAASLHVAAVPNLPHRAAHAARAAELSVGKQTDASPVLAELAHVSADLGGYAQKFDFNSLAQTVAG